MSSNQITRIAAVTKFNGFPIAYLLKTFSKRFNCYQCKKEFFFLLITIFFFFFFGCCCCCCFCFAVTIAVVVAVSCWCCCCWWGAVSFLSISRKRWLVWFARKRQKKKKLKQKLRSLKNFVFIYVTLAQHNEWQTLEIFLAVL